MHMYVYIDEIYACKYVCNSQCLAHGMTHNHIYTHTYIHILTLVHPHIHIHMHTYSFTQTHGHTSSQTKYSTTILTDMLAILSDVVWLEGLQTRALLLLAITLLFSLFFFHTLQNLPCRHVSWIIAPSTSIPHDAYIYIYIYIYTADCARAYTHSCDYNRTYFGWRVTWRWLTSTNLLAMGLSQHAMEGLSIQTNFYDIDIHSK